MTTSTEERLSRLEGGYEHLATKADLERLRADVDRSINALTWKLISVQLLIGGVIIGVLRLLG